MFSIAGRVLDVYDDVKKDLLRSNLEKVGTLTLDPPDDIGKLPDDKFAGIFITKTGREIRKYPIHTPDAAALSGLYFDNAAEELPKEACQIIRSNISIACQGFGIGWNGMEKGASAPGGNRIFLCEFSNPMKKIAYVSNFALRGKYPIDTEEQIKQASEYFNDNSIKFTPADRAEYAGNVLSRAKAIGVDIGNSDVHKYAGDDFGNLVQSAFHERSCLLSEDEMALRTLQHLFEKKASLGPSGFAEELESFDRSNQLDRYWDRSIGVRNPYRSTYEGLNMSRMVKVGSESISEEQLQTLIDSGVIKTAFSDDFCKQLAEAPIEVFQSLPSPEQQVIVEMLGDI